MGSPRVEHDLATEQQLTRGENQSCPTPTAGGASGKKPPANAGNIETQVSSLGQCDPLEEGMATHSSILAWRIPRTGEPGSF